MNNIMTSQEVSLLALVAQQAFTFEDVPKKHTKLDIKFLKDNIGRQLTTPDAKIIFQILLGKKPKGIKERHNKIISEYGQWMENLRDRGNENLQVAIYKLEQAKSHLEAVKRRSGDAIYTGKAILKANIK